MQLTVHLNYKLIGSYSLIQDHIHSSKKTVPFFALTETHLKSRHFDAEVNVDGYNIFRADRIKRHQGGSAVYVHKSLAVTKSLSYSNSFCETAGIFIQPLNLVVFSVYRPPAAAQAYFEESISKMQDFINQLDSPEVLVLGDFNLPFVSWEPVITVNPEKKSVTTSDQNSAKALITFMEEHFLQQFVTEPTRKDLNILDLVLSNNSHAVHSINVIKTEISDHDFVYCNLSYNTIPQIKQPAPDLHQLDKLDLNYILIWQIFPRLWKGVGEGGCWMM